MDYLKISVVTPSYNQGDFLDSCICSVLSLNYPNLEYIVMDGGSTDNSVEIIKKYEKHLTYWQSIPDNGQYDAINKGFQKTTGEIMTWINSDDMLHFNSLEIVTRIFTNLTDVEWIMGRPNTIDDQNRLIGKLDHVPLWSRENYLKKQYKYPSYIQQEGTFWRRSLWDKAGGTLDIRYKLAGDLELWARFFRYSVLHSVDALLGAFRMHPKRKTATLLKNYDKEAEKIIEREIALYNQSVDKTLFSAPPPISAPKIAQLMRI